MSFCEHCEGQRFDRARVLRKLRQLQKDLRGGKRQGAGAALDMALRAVKDLDIPHVEFVETTDEVVH